MGYAREAWSVTAIYTAIQNGDDLITYASSPFTQASLSTKGMTHDLGTRRFLASPGRTLDTLNLSGVGHKRE